MTETPRPPVALWAAEPPPAARGRLVPPRTLRQFVLAAAALAVVGAFGGLLAWFRPLSPPYFVPLWVTQYRSPAIPDPAATEADREAVRAAGLLPRGADAYSSQEGPLILREVGLLDRLPSAERVVVYLSGYALDRADGGVDFLPADADPVFGQGAVPLADLLGRVKRSPPRAKLVVLDVARPWTDPRAGALRADVTARLPALVRRVEDEHRRAGGPAQADWLVLLACAPGQAAHDAPAFGRTAFGLFFEEGLRGAAAGGHRLRHDGRITARDLAAYLADRVDGWARATHGVRQTPVLLGDGPDFDLAAADRSPPAAEPDGADPYPPWLAAGWRTVAAWRADETLAASPRLVHQAQDVMRTVDASRGGGAGDGRFAGQLKFTLARLAQERRAALAAPPRPARPASLALAARFGVSPDPTVNRAAAAMVNGWRTGPPPKPEEREAKMAQAVQTFLAAAAKATRFAVEEAVFAQAADAAGHADLLLLLDRVFHELRDPPVYIESRFLRRLADAARQAPAEWPADLARSAVAAVRRTEEACARPDLLPWAGPLLEACAEARWEGELLLTHWGSVPPEVVGRRFQDAGRRAEALLAFAAVLDAARAAADDSLVALLPDAEYLDEEPARAAAWDARVRATADLLPLLDPPSRPAASVDDLLALTDGLRGPGETLRQELAGLHQDVYNGRAALSLAAAGRDDAGPAVARRIDALLRLPGLSPDRRAVLAQARTALAVRLAQRPADPAPPYTAAAADEARRDEDRRAARRARCHLAVLRLADVPAEVLAKALQLLARAEREGPDSRAWPELADGLRRAWADGLPAAFARAAPGGRDTLAALYPGDWPNPAIDTPPGGPRVARRSAVWRGHFAWLASRYRYVARAGLDPTTMEDAAADADAGVAAPTPYPAVVVRPPASPVVLPPDRPSAEVIVTVVQTGPAVGPLTVRALVPGDAVRVTVVEESLRLADSPTEGGRSAAVRLRVDRAAAASALPAGFVVEARVGGRAGFARVTLAAGPPAAALELVIDRSPTDPGGLGNDLRLRPAAVGQPFYAFVRNRTSQPRQAVVRVSGPAGPVPGGEAKVTVNAGETKFVPFVPAAGPATGGPPAFDLPGALRLDVEDAAKSGEIITSRSVRLDVADPVEYLELTAATFEPSDPPARQVNRLRVTLRARRDLGPVPCFAELVLDSRAVPGLRGVKAGRFRGQVPPTGDPLVLNAEGLDLDPGAAEVGTAFVTVDGVERAFGLRVDFARRGDPTAPVLDTTPRLTLALRPAPRPGRSVAFVVAADHAPTGSRLDVRLLRTDPTDPRPEQAETLPAPRHKRATVVVGPGGALVVTATVSDWELNWDLARVVGRRTLAARLTAGGRVLQTVELPLVLDDTPPTVAFRDPPRQVKRGSPVLFRVDAGDPESGVTGVQVYVGKPAADGNPPAGAVPVAATPSSDGGWEVRLPLPADKRGPTDISARAINGAGLSAWATTAVDLVDTLPTPPGAVAGRVLEGDRPQAGLEVQLLDEKGTVLKRTTTDADGKYRFDAVTPGRYRLASAKSSSRRTAKANVTVAAGQTATVDLPLYL